MGRLRLAGLADSFGRTNYDACSSDETRRAGSDVRSAMASAPYRAQHERLRSDGAIVTA